MGLDAGFNVFSKFKSTSKNVNLQFLYNPTFLVYEKIDIFLWLKKKNALVYDISITLLWLWIIKTNVGGSRESLGLKSIIVKLGFKPDQIIVCLSRFVDSLQLTKDSSMTSKKHENKKNHSLVDSVNFAVYIFD